MSLLSRATVVVAAAFLALVVVAAVFPGLLTPIDPLGTDPGNALRPPGPEHLLGTDQSGRDLLARVIHGARYSLVIGVGATLAALLGGGLVGLLAGLASRRVDGVLSRATEVLLALPEFLLALLIVAILGPGEFSLALGIALAAAPAYARVARVQTLVVRHSGQLTAAVALGIPPVVRTLRHVVPHIVGPLLVMATIGLGTAIVSAAGLSFLGLGPSAPTPEWGLILSEGRNHLARAWWVAVFPGLAIMATVLATSVVGRRVRRAREGVRA